MPTTKGSCAVEDVDREPRSLRTDPFPSEPRSVTAARHGLLQFLNGDVPRKQAQIAALLVSELAANAVQHARSAFTVCAELTGLGLRVEVADGASDAPVVRNPSMREVGGRGMLVVSRLADRWGTQPLPDGKIVWFELDPS
jgi:anti-sigma regulatory factor (Ser/Thr protein kinase)